MIGHFPYLPHRLVLEGVQGVGIMPLLKGQTLRVAAVGFMQAHAPLGCRLGNGVVFGF